ncbi:MAG TPA: WD40 repeat domain-containing protein, partial [Thermoanaerobaculia bacterium]|nr:WD40 repeat domain-containing protein [Thermoanaerobaculia bacterium]
EAEEPAVRSFTGHSGWILALCIISTEEGPRILSGGADGRVLVWDPEGQSDAPLCSLDYHNGVVRALTAYERPEGWRIVSAGDDRVLHIWSFEDPGQHQKIDCYTRSIRGVAAFRSRSGWALVTGSADQLVRVHELDERDQVRETQILRGHNDWVRGVCAIQVPTGEGVSLATGSDDGSLKLWSYPATSTNPLRSYEDNRTWLRAVCVAGSGQASRVAAAGADGRIHFWKLGGSRAPQQSLSGHPSWVRALLILPSADPEDCRLVSAGDDGSVRLWNPLGKTPGHPQILRSGSTPIRALAHFDMNGEDWLAAVGDEGLVYIWALDRPESSLRSLKGSTDWLRTVCAFREGPRWLIAAGGDDRVLRVWDPVLPTEEPVAEHQGHTDSLRALCAIPGANEPLLVSTSDDGTLRTWNWREGEARCVQGHKGSGLALCARSIGQRWSVVSASADQSVKIWCAHTLMLLAEVPTLSPNFAVAAYGPDTLAVGNQRGLLWIDLVDRRDSH